MMRTVICLTLALSAAALKLPKLEAIQPKYAEPPEGAGIAWQRPAGAVKGIVLYLHGCGNYATDSFSTLGKDGFRLAVCDTKKSTPCRGKTEETLARKKARARGYIFATVQGGTASPRVCSNKADIPKIK